MRALAEIKQSIRVQLYEESEDGFNGFYRFPDGDSASLVVSWGDGWEHVSIRMKNPQKIPTWGQMCRVKKTFFKDCETVVQYHPAESQYVSNINALHLWRPIDAEMVCPPQVYVGWPEDMTSYELKKAIKDAYDHPYLSDKELEKV